MNWRFGYSLGMTEFDGLIYGAASAAADCLKALIPFFLFAAIRNRMWSQAAASAVVWVVVTAYSLTSALGQTSLGGHPQVVRPLLAPMAEAAAEKQHGELDEKTRWYIRAQAAAVDNIGLFFGEDVFIAIGSILLIKSYLEQTGVVVEPADLARWAIPTALAAFVIHGTRLMLLDRRVKAMSSRRNTTAE